MWPRHPQQKDFYPDLPLIDGDKVVELDPDQSQLTTRYTERAVQLHRAQPGQAVLPLRAAHDAARAAVRLGQVQGQDRQGLYGDVIMEIDWSVGQILDAVKRGEARRATRW